MSEELRGFYGIMKGLLWGIVGIIMAFFAILLFIIVLPPALQILSESGSASQSIREVARGLSGALGGLASAIFALIAAFIVIWILATLLPLIFRNKSWKYIGHKDEALEALRVRYAKGELTKEQYLETKKTLEA